jgi:arabinofuranosyltransferase
MEIARVNAFPWLRPAVLYALWLGLFFLLFAKSWVSEDAYITFRVIDNVIHGYGLRWNVAERVQVYTHPLWLLLHLPFALVWDNLFHLNMALSLLCSSLAVAIVLLTFRKSLGTMVVFFMLPLFLSKCFVDYAGSGLETSLSYLLFALLGYVLVHWQERACFPFAFTFCVALLLLNRLDHLVLLAPLIFTIFWSKPALYTHGRNRMMITFGVLPLVAWFAFSLWYYGFLFPNTKYAKLDTGFPLTEYLSQGLQYAFIWLTQDTVSVVIVLAALILSFVIKHPSHAIYRALSLGIICNLCYVIYIGGDYMMGRFFAFVFFASIWLLLAQIPLQLRGDIVFSCALLCLTATMFSYFVRDIRLVCDACIPVKGKVIDARRIFGGNALFSSLWPPHMRSEGEYKFAYEGKKLAEEYPPPVKPLRYVGMMGYYAGAQVFIVDELALGDALLSRLPAARTRFFYVGHYRRNLPKGYLHALESDRLDSLHPALAEYYAALRLITRGALWDGERLSTIIRFNSGYYDHYKYDFLRSTP